MHNKRLTYTVRVAEPKPGLATLYYDLSQGEGNARGPWNEGQQ